MNNKLLLIVGIVLCCFGLLHKDFWSFNKPNFPSLNVINIEQPSDKDLLESAKRVVDILKKNNASTQDCSRLSALYSDIAQLISLDSDKQLVRSTEEIRQANRISGLMLKMDLNDKYPNLASSMNNLIVGTIGDDNVPLTKELREKGVDAFLALSWACQEGSK